ncbi:hypothetical protein BGX29_010520 [Mortierella sp. GBA35]|nr:hypothetical protein BGX29_010520 [Mortierella sp. GBA35]
MNSSTIQKYITHYNEETHLYQEKERKLTDILLHLPIDAESAPFDGTPLSVNELRRQFYETRHLIHLFSIVLRDAIDILRVFNLEVSEELKITLEMMVKLVVNKLQYEIEICSLLKTSELLNANHAFRSKWLMYNYAQKFEHITGHVPHPGGADPNILYTQE